jgi:hypothetical protein
VAAIFVHNRASGALLGYHVAADASRGEPCNEAQQKIRQKPANAAIADEQQDLMPGYAKNRIGA